MNRRSIMLAAALLVTAGASTISAQAGLNTHASWGVLAGANFAKVSDASGVNTRTGVVVGLSADFNLANHFGLEIDGLYSQQGAKETIDGTEVTLHLDYAAIPVLLRYRFPTKGTVHPFVVLGPQVGFRVKCEVTAGSDSASCSDFAGVNAKSVDFSGTVGAGLGFQVGKEELSLQARYNMGFTKIFDNANSNSKNRVVSVMAGFAF
ncbi:MAG: PorT family protein [Gemmatimonadota bacterium]|nr:PorT family protein [Gemmatimonadota bacterium]